MSGFNHSHVPKLYPVRRSEVITGLGVLRELDPDVKAVTMMGALATGVVISQAERRHDIGPH